MITEDQPDGLADRSDRLDAWLVLTRQIPPPDGTVRLPMLSGSMNPTLPPGSLLVIDPRCGDRFRRGDVVVMADGERLVAHRVLLRLGSRFLEMGDAGLAGCWRRSDDVSGRVISATPPRGDRSFDPFAPERATRGLLRFLRLTLTRAVARHPESETEDRDL
jgi:hypothetical protein